MVVTITAPIYPRKFTVGVVGLQLKYMDFVQTMEDAVTIKAVPLTNQEHPLSCKDTVRLYCKQKHYHLSLSFIYIYNETCLNLTSLGPGYLFKIDRGSVYIG